MNLNKKRLTKTSLLDMVKPVDIYRYYTGQEVSLRHKILSPLRDEKRPSFGYFIGRDDELCFNDYLLGGGDCIRFVEMKFNLKFYEALSKIAKDFNVDNDFIVHNLVQKTNKELIKSSISQEELMKSRSVIKLGKTRRKWLKHDILFWRQFNISLDMLNNYNVQPIQYLFINGKPIACDKYAYAFVEYKDGTETYKIYQPFSDFKWLSNHNHSVWQGWENLPEKGKILIITKSLKDVMSLRCTLGLPSVALQSEKINPKSKVIAELKERFDDIFVLYDNDYDKKTNWGREFGLKLCFDYNLFQIEIDEIYKSKDFSDLIKNHGADKAKEIILNLINK